jgi:23S rRNA G2445 N2-methylase RlmL
VIARKAGSQAFRRVDVQHAVEHAILSRYPRWRVVEDDARLELWVHLVERTFLAGFRLSDITMRQRTYRRESIPAALKPTVAHAMVMLSVPRDGDVFLDPMCGSGTILIERAEASRYRLLLGGDSDPAAVAATRANVGPRYKPIQIRQWDARNLPLDDHSVTAVVTNLPFGKQIGTPAEIRTLYPALLKEWTRVLAPGGRMVLLTADRSLLARALGQHPELVQKRTLSVLVRGYRATIFVVHHREK